MNDMKKRKLMYGGHVMRGFYEESHLYILEGKIDGKKNQGYHGLMILRNGQGLRHMKR